METLPQRAPALGEKLRSPVIELIRPINMVAPEMETLRDGTGVLVRPIRDDDVELERRFIEQLSPQSRRYRFLGAINSPDAQLLRQFTHLDNVNDVAFIALIAEGAGEREIGVARYSAQSDGATCECAVAVSDQWHKLGLATLLMHYVINAARRNGFSSMIAMAAADNQPMHELAYHLGFTRLQDPNDATQVLHTLDLNALTVWRSVVRMPLQK